VGPWNETREKYAAHFQSKLIATERFVETVQRLGFGEVEFHAPPTR
jgi:hypothetical protein